MKEKFLTKNTKITIKEDTNYLTPPPAGLKTYRKIHDEDGKINKKALSDFTKKLEDYYGDELEELDPIPKVDGEDEVGSDDVDIFSIEALGGGKMSSLEYEAEGSEVEKKFQKRVDDLNDTSEYDKTFGTKDGFGETDKPDDTYKKLKKASAEYNKYEKEYELPNPLRVRQAKEIKAESKQYKTKKMKRLNFKNKFNTEYEMKKLIPENYKTDGNTFLMTDGNQVYKVRWDGSLKEGTILGYKNKSQINEDVKKMKKLYSYEYSDSQSPTNDYITETNIMKKLMKKPLVEGIKGATSGYHTLQQEIGECVNLYFDKNKQNWDQTWKIESIDPGKNQEDTQWGNIISIKVIKGLCKDGTKLVDKDGKNATLTYNCNKPNEFEYTPTESGQKPGTRYHPDFSKKFAEFCSDIKKGEEIDKPAGVKYASVGTDGGSDTLG